jgi:hypothetical protein
MPGPESIPALILLFGIPLAAIAGIMAAILIHAEMSHHLDDRRAWREAAGAGVFAFVVFVLLTAVAAAYVPYITR